MQTLKDLLDHRKPPEQLLGHSDVSFCEGVPEPKEVEAVPAKIPFLMIVGVCQFADVLLPSAQIVS